MEKTPILKFFTCEEFDVGIEFSPGGEPFLHLPRLDSWSLSVYKKLILTLVHTKRALSDLGYRMVFVIIPDNDAKRLKFEEMMGFTEVTRNDGMILMGQETS